MVRRPITPTRELRRDPVTGMPQLPAENAAYLGRSLFTDYLLPVELGGFLLLVAAIGAIAIAQRRRQSGERLHDPGAAAQLPGRRAPSCSSLGMIGFLTRRNLIIMFLCAEMMLQGVAINLVAFARYRGNLQGQVFVLFIVTVAACEAAIALALILMLFRKREIAGRQPLAGLARGGPGADPRRRLQDPLPLPAKPPDAAAAAGRPRTTPQTQETSHV